MDSRYRRLRCLRPTPDDDAQLGNQNHYLSGVPLLVDAPQVVSRPSLDRFSIPDPRIAIGLALRDPRISSLYNEAHWTSSVLFCLLADLMDAWDFDANQFDSSYSLR